MGKYKLINFRIKLLLLFLQFSFPIFSLAHFDSPRTDSSSVEWFNSQDESLVDTYCTNNEYKRRPTKIPMCHQILAAIKITKKNVDTCKSKGDRSFLNCIAYVKNAVLHDSLIDSCNKIEDGRIFKNEISTFGQCMSYFINTSSKFQTEAVEECAKNNFYDVGKAIICFDIIRDKELPEETFREPKAVCKKDTRINPTYNECLRSQTLALPSYCEALCRKKDPVIKIETPAPAPTKRRRAS